MKSKYAGMMFTALALSLLAAACAPATTPAPEDTLAPPATEPATTDTPVVVIPITGSDITNEGRFCVDDVAYAVEVMPQGLTYSTSTTGVACVTGDTVNGKQVMLCRGPSLGSFPLSVCSGPDNCVDKQVDLGQCPLPTPAPTDTPTATATGASPEASPTDLLETPTATP